MVSVSLGMYIIMSFIACACYHEENSLQLHFPNTATRQI